MTVRPSEIVPVAALSGLGVVDLALSGRSVFPGHPAGSAVLLLAVAVPLFWRRTAPVVALAVIAAIAYGWIYAVYYERDLQPPIEAGLALMVAMYSAAAYASRSGLVVAGVLSGAVVAADAPRLLAGAEVGETVPAWLFYLLAYEAAIVRPGEQSPPS